jgi:hypothetical protein
MVSGPFYTVKSGLDRIVAWCYLLILFIPDSRTYSVPLSLKRQRNRTLGQVLRVQQHRHGRGGLHHGPGPPGRLSVLSIFHSKSVSYGVFVWARRALNSPKRRFSARAVPWRRARARRALGEARLRPRHR